MYPVMMGVFSPKKGMCLPGPKEGEPLGLLQMLPAVAVLCSPPLVEHWMVRKADGETHSLSQEF